MQVVQMWERTDCIVEKLQYRNGALNMFAWIMKPKGHGPFPTVIWNHGSRVRVVNDRFVDETHLSTIEPETPPYPGIVDRGWLWFFPECRGYAGSDGASVFSLAPEGPDAIVAFVRRRAEDVLVGIDLLKQRRDVQADNLALCGSSHGGATTLFAAAARPRAFKTVIVQAPGFWKGHVPNGRADLAVALRAIASPVLVQHFVNDPLVPVSMSRDLLHAVPNGTAVLKEYPGVEGVDGHFQFLPGNFEQMIGDFMATLDRGLSAPQRSAANA